MLNTIWNGSIIQITMNNMVSLNVNIIKLFYHPNTWPLEYKMFTPFLGTSEYFDILL